MNFPLDFSTFTLWLGTTSIILLISVGFFSLGEGKTTVRIDKKRFRNVALVLSVVFLALTIVGIIRR